MLLLTQASKILEYCENNLCYRHKFMILTCFVSVNEIISIKNLMLGYKHTTSLSHDFNITTTKRLSTQILYMFSVNRSIVKS